MPDLPVTIELRPHVGFKFDPQSQSRIEVEHNQWIVLARVGGYYGVRKGTDIVPKQIGYLGKWPGAEFVAIPEFGQIAARDQKLVMAALAKEVGYAMDCVKRNAITGANEIVSADTGSDPVAE